MAQMTVLGLSEAVLRLVVFMGVFGLCAASEALRPRRARAFGRVQRWYANFGMLALATALVRIAAFALPALVGAAAALMAQRNGWGLLNWLAWPAWLEITLAVIALDFVIWAQHVATHRVPLLWRIHRVHHSDRDLDASSALRFHPLEILFSAAVKLAAIVLLGPAILAVIIFEIVLNASAIFNHSNIAIPPALDRILRTVIVTPDMHRVHHSIIRREHDNNFGFCLSVWDRLFGVYTAQPSAGHDRMTIGLDRWQDERPTQLGWTLRFPFSDR